MVHLIITALTLLTLRCQCVTPKQQLRLFQIGETDWSAAIDAIQGDCNTPAENISLGYGGGFASMFQMAAWQATTALKVDKTPIQLLGHFDSYSDNVLCKRIIGDEMYNSFGTFTCFFESLNTCKNGLSASTRMFISQIWDEAVAMLGKTDVYKNCSLFFAVENFLFRPNNVTLDRFKKMLNHTGLPTVRDGAHQGNVLIGVHIRRGDKMSDAYNKYINTTQYVRAIRAWAEQASSLKYKKCSVFVASDCRKSLDEVRRMLDGKAYGNCLFEVHGSANTTTQLESRKKTSIKDRLKEVKDFTKFNLMNDILFDIHVLSQADVLVGTLSSQIGRMAAGLRWAIDPSAEPPIALDISAKPAVEMATQIGGLPLCDLEGWVAPPVGLESGEDEGESD